MTQDIQQSKKYGQYMEKMGWTVERVNGCQIFIRQFPLIGSFIKIQRPAPPIPFKKIEKIVKKYRAFKVAIELGKKEKLRDRGYKKSNSPYLPTKTIHINLTQSDKEILEQFKKKTRYCLRHARKNELTVKKSRNIDSFIKLKSSQFFPFDFLVKKDIKALWKTFSPKNAVLLEAKCYDDMYHCSKLLAGILLLLHRNTAHYWLATSTNQGKKLFAPTLLVWEALKFSKKRGCKIFDFQGIYDPRFYKANKSWQGFTRFKKGFGGKEIEYPGCFVKYKLSF